MTNTGQLAQDIWDEFSSDPVHCHLVAEAIKTGADTKSPNEVTEEVDALGTTEAPEGRLLTRRHVYRERNRKIIDSKKKAALLQGALSCAVCGFEYQAHYSPHGESYIECHHIKPLSEYKPGDKTRLDDLELLCANCHRMIHSTKPWLTVAELRKIWIENH